MSIGKMLSIVGATALLWIIVPQAGWVQQPGCASCNTFSASSHHCGPTCQWHHCPGVYKYCYEGGPHLHYKRGCPHPICNPCDLPHWGYYDVCYTPWPFPPNWHHCPTPPPAAFVQLNPYMNPNMPPPVVPRPTTLPTVPYTQPMPPLPNRPNGNYEQLPAPNPVPQKQRPPM